MRLQTTNGGIVVSSFNGTTLELNTTNGAIESEGGTVEAQSIELQTTNGIVRAGEAEDGLSTVEADLIVIKTSNGELSRRFFGFVPEAEPLCFFFTSAAAGPSEDFGPQRRSELPLPTLRSQDFSLESIEVCCFVSLLDVEESSDRR